MISEPQKNAAVTEFSVAGGARSVLRADVFATSFAGVLCSGVGDGFVLSLELALLAVLLSPVDSVERQRQRCLFRHLLDT